MRALAALILALAYPALTARVNDQAGALEPEDAAAINATLAALEKSDSTQVVVLTVKTTGEVPIEDYALGVARKNALGQKGKSNGILVLVAVDDHACRIEVGEGLEGRLPDTIAALIVKHEMVPRFRAGDISGGVRAGVLAVARAVKGEYKAPPRADEKELGITGGLLLAAMALYVLWMIKRGRGGDLLTGMAIGMLTGGRGGSSSSSSGSGFSGGGGRFSGGGASGSW